METKDLACRLTEPDLVRRINDWRTVAARAKNRTITANTVVSEYPNDPTLLAALERLIEAEKDCCSFMDFRIDESADELVVHLQVPEEMQVMLGVMLGLVSGAEELPMKRA